MNVKLTVVLCLMFYMTKAFTFNKSFEEVLKKLGFGHMDQYDYNTFILGIETEIEAAQKAAVDTIEKTVDLAEEFARVVKILGVQQNVRQINDIQSTYFQSIEDMRYKAYNQQVDISKCAFNAVHQLNIESQKSISNVTNILTNISNIFNNYSQVTYTEPADKNLQKTYTIRERIYQCPFSFTDFTPFYVCLTTTAVLEDLVVLNQFTSSLNETIKEIVNLVLEYGNAATLFRNENVKAYNATASQVYDDLLVPCAQDQGLYN